MGILGAALGTPGNTAVPANVGSAAWPFPSPVDARSCRDAGIASPCTALPANGVQFLSVHSNGLNSTTFACASSSPDRSNTADHQHGRAGMGAVIRCSRGTPRTGARREGRSAWGECRRPGGGIPGALLGAAAGALAGRAMRDGLPAMQQQENRQSFDSRNFWAGFNRPGNMGASSGNPASWGTSSGRGTSGGSMSGSGGAYGPSFGGSFGRSPGSFSNSAGHNFAGSGNVASGKR